MDKKKHIIVQYFGVAVAGSECLLQPYDKLNLFDYLLLQWLKKLRQFFGKSLLDKPETIDLVLFKNGHSFNVEFFLQIVKTISSKKLFEIIRTIELKIVFMKLKALLTFICITVSVNILQTQTNYKLSNSKNTGIKLSGISTMHDWVMKSKTYTGEAQFNFKPGAGSHLQSLNSLSFSLLVQTLKSDKKLMNKNAYKALKIDQYSNIIFKLDSANVLPQQKNKYLINAFGNLTVAGVTKAIALDTYCIVNSDKSISCIGSKKSRMSDYQIVPPIFLKGTMKTGDEITVDFVLVFTIHK